MGETSDEIERHIQEQREQLERSIGELQQKVKETVDWRAQFEQRPMMMLGIAVGGGLLLSALFGSHSRSVKPSSNDGESFKAGDPMYAKPFRAEEPPSRTSESLREIKAALIGVAAAKLGGALDSVIPGFSDEYSKVRNGNGTYRPGR